MICSWCGKEFTPTRKNIKYCRKECCNANSSWTYTRKKINRIVETGVEGEDYIIDKWNGLPVVRMFGAWMRHMHPGKTIEDYRRDFPGAKVAADKDIMNFCRSSGKFMQNEEYKKKYSEMMRGERNPMHKSNTTEEFRKSNSPFSDSFYLSRGIDVSLKKKCIEKAKNNRKNNTRLDFYLNLGMNEKDAKEKLSKRQKTKTLSKAIEKYGEKGEEIYTKRNSDWVNIMKKKYANGDYSTIRKNTSNENSFSSHIERDFFNKLIDVSGLLSNECKYAKNKKNDQLEIVYNINGVTHRYSYDFSYKNKIIEFNGDFWHMNPKLYESGDINPITKKVAAAIWENDSNKIKIAKESGYEVFVVWESEYINDEDNTLNKAKLFICE